ncbi:27631_t:CDS:1, partial [Gigaspora margarita]
NLPQLKNNDSNDEFNYLSQLQPNNSSQLNITNSNYSSQHIVTNLNHSSNSGPNHSTQHCLTNSIKLNDSPQHHINSSAVRFNYLSQFNNSSQSHIINPDEPYDLRQLHVQ